ncbi:unnamed protein product [Rotaria magnacalcarata]|uniref:VWFA domain-containing protein n=4 Tax=Rotaria magnacalcarata TaxID=392030 RepID=A0A816Q150_9BILA|nr:unnamed protein product [Rotaria magnacalcarata]CAF1667553.1 unnamed protein product [Rotaria magnacalcarata]CAF2043625.1 unnamed protein product [Rotaria magnacalcarata]CAF2056340.1 unnamed protein product [Rotaria magnacalcarata]
MKTTLFDIIQDLRSGSIRIGILFYGSSATVNVLHTPANDRESIERIKNKIDQKQFRHDNAHNPSTLQAAFAEVERICITSCRNIFIPRVTVVLTSAKQPEIEKKETERFGTFLRMTVIAVGIGNQVNRTALSLVASEPFTYTISLDSFTSLVMTAKHISSLVSSVSPALHYADSPPAKYYDSNYFDWYNSIQYVVTHPKDHIVILNFETDACCNHDSEIKVYASKFDPMPTSDNSEETKSYTSEQCGMSTHFKYYLFVREQIKRLYISFIVNNKPQTIKFQASIIDYQTMTSAIESCTTATYSQSFTTGVMSNYQCAAWKVFVAGLTCSRYRVMRFSGSRNPAGIVITDPKIVNSIAAALRASTNYAVNSNGFAWAVGTCGTGMELSAAGTICTCTNGYILKPCDVYANWGGIDGITCSPPAQSITLSFE